MKFSRQTFVMVATGLAVWLTISTGFGGRCFAESPNPAERHPVSIVTAEVFVQRFRTTMRLKCYADELELLQGVEALEDGLYDEDELLDAHEDHAEFLAERIELLDVDGNRIKPMITNIVEFEIPEAGIAQGTLMKYELEYSLEFRYDEPPEFLTINQRMAGEGQVQPSELKVLVKQSGNDEPMLQMIKPETPQVFRFDWDAAPLTSELSEEDRQKWFEAQNEKLLGITSYSSVYSFIYITKTEVRHEVLIPVATLAGFVEFDRAEERFLTVEEQDRAIPMIEALFESGSNRVTIDGVKVPPKFDQIEFYGLDMRDFVMGAPRKTISMANGRVGVIMSYDCKVIPPRDVKITWQIFNDVLQNVESVVFRFDDVEKFRFSRFNPDNTWHFSDPDRKPLPPLTEVDAAKYPPATWEIPVASCVLGLLGVLTVLLCRSLFGTGLALAIGVMCIGGAFLARGTSTWTIANPLQPEVESGDEIFAQLHANLFRAFDYRNDDDVYDALANSVDGEQLRDLFLKVNDSLRVREKGGAVARIDQVSIVDGQTAPPTKRLERPGFGYRCTWNLLGTVEHWGHIHQRATEYEANFDVELCNDAWKITSMQVDNLKHGAIKQAPRKIEPASRPPVGDKDRSLN